MAKELNPQNAAEFEYLLKFLQHFDQYGWIPARTIEIDIRAATIDIEKKFGKSKAFIGLKMALNDILEMTASRDSQWVSDFDKSCRSIGSKTLSEFRIAYWSKYKRLLERGKINNQAQFYMVMTILNDQMIKLSESDHEKLSEMMHNFEKK